MNFISNSANQFEDLIGNKGFAIGTGRFDTGEIDVRTTYKTDWINLYNSNGWLTSDPVVRKGTSFTGFGTWTLDGASREFATAAEDFGLRQGAVISSSIGGHRCIAGLPLDGPADEKIRRILLQHTRRIHLETLMENARQLSDSQQELVNLFAFGLRAKQVAAEMGITTEAVKQRKLTIQKTLGVDNFLVAVNICSRMDALRHLINHG